MTLTNRFEYCGTSFPTAFPTGVTRAPLCDSGSSKIDLVQLDLQGSEADSRAHSDPTRNTSV